MSSPFVANFHRVLSGLLIVLLGAAFWVSVSTQSAPLAPYAVERGQVDDVEYSAIRSTQPDNEPTWSKAYAGQFPGCGVLDGQLHDEVVVVGQDGTAARMGFDAAWAAGKDTAWANDVWTIGGCA